MECLWRALGTRALLRPALQGVLEKYRRERLRSVPFFDGLVTGEIDALIESFSGVPEVHHPVRGRIKGESAFRRFVADMTSWLAARKIDVEHVNFLITDPRGVEEVVLHLDGDGGRIGSSRGARGRPRRATSASSSCACTSAPGR